MHEDDRSRRRYGRRIFVAPEREALSNPVAPFDVNSANVTAISRPSQTSSMNRNAKNRARIGLAKLLALPLLSVTVLIAGKSRADPEAPTADPGSPPPAESPPSTPPPSEPEPPGADEAPPAEPPSDGAAVPTAPSSDASYSAAPAPTAAFPVSPPPPAPAHTVSPPPSDPGTPGDWAAVSPAPGSPSALDGAQPLSPAPEPPATSSLVFSGEPPKDTVSQPETEDEYKGLFGPLRIGPMVGSGLPNLLSFGGALKLTRYFGAGVSFGLIPTLHIAYYGEATVTYHEYEAYAHLHPFGNGFFLGAGVGYETVKGTLTDTVDTSSYTSQAAQLGLPATVRYMSRGSVHTLILTPVLGYLHTFRSGFSLGIDVGAQIPIAPSQITFTSQTDPGELASIVAPYSESIDQKVRDTLERIGRTPIPTLSVRMGWLL